MNIFETKQGTKLGSLLENFLRKKYQRKKTIYENLQSN